MVSTARKLIKTNTAKLVFIAIMIIASGFVLKRWIDLYATPPPLEELFPRGEIYVGVDASYPPFAVVVDNDLKGIDIELARELGKRIGMEVHFVNMGFDGLYDSLISGQVDLVISALLIDKFRTADVNYSWAYFNSGLILISDTQDDYKTMSEVSGKSVAYEFGSDADSEMRAWSRRVPPMVEQPYELPRYALDAVRLGQADAALVDAISGRLYLRDHPEWDAEYHYVTTALFSAASRIDRKWVFKLVNAAMLEMLNDGTIDAILDRWM